VQAGAAGDGARQGRHPVAAVFGSRKIGADGTTVSAWAGQTVGVGVGASRDRRHHRHRHERAQAAARASLPAGRPGRHRHEELFFSGNAQQTEELFRDLTFISHDYRNGKPLETPDQPQQILNITILPPNDGSAAFANYRRLDLHRGAVVQVGDVLGRVRSADGRVPLRPDKMNRPHPQMEQWLGAARSEDIKVVKILTKI
jgi:hypothetical protein